MAVLCSAALVVVSCAGIAHADPDRSGAGDFDVELDAVWEELDRAWNARDVEGFSALYTEDASFAFVDRDHAMTGRAAIREHFSAQFARTAPEYSHHTKISDLRAMGPGLLGVDGVVEVHRNAEPFRRFAIFAMMKSVEGAWLIDAIRIYALVESAPDGSH